MNKMRKIIYSKFGLAFFLFLFTTTLYLIIQGIVLMLRKHEETLSTIPGIIDDYPTKDHLLGPVNGASHVLKMNNRIVDEILKEKRKLHDLKVSTNYSVLRDPYYVVQGYTTDETNPAPNCVSVSYKLADYKLCAVNMKDRIFAEAESGTYRLRQVLTLIQLLQSLPNAAYIDIGANCGFLLFPILAVMEFQIKTIAVEANPQMLGCLMTTFKANNVSENSFAVIQVGLSDTVDELVDFGPARPDAALANAGDGTVIGKMQKNTANLNKANAISVLTATLDSHVLPVAKALNITTAILKMDIEGSECLAMRQAQKFLANIFVPFIIMEHFIPYTTEACLQEMYAILHSLNYYPFSFESNGFHGMLDTKDFKNWGETFPRGIRYGNILWKKLV